MGLQQSTVCCPAITGDLCSICRCWGGFPDTPMCFFTVVAKWSQLTSEKKQHDSTDGCCMPQTLVAWQLDCHFPLVCNRTGSSATPPNDRSHWSGEARHPPTLGCRRILTCPSPKTGKVMSWDIFSEFFFQYLLRDYERVGDGRWTSCPKSDDWWILMDIDGYWWILMDHPGGDARWTSCLQHSNTSSRCGCQGTWAQAEWPPRLV